VRIAHSREEGIALGAVFFYRLTIFLHGGLFRRKTACQSVVEAVACGSKVFDVLEFDGFVVVGAYSFGFSSL
jgi:hypothetical protein